MIHNTPVLLELTLTDFWTLLWAFLCKLTVVTIYCMWMFVIVDQRSLVLCFENIHFLNSGVLHCLLVVLKMVSVLLLFMLVAIVTSQCR